MLVGVASWKGAVTDTPLGKGLLRTRLLEGEGESKLLASSATREGGDAGLVRWINGEFNGRRWVDDLPEGLRPCRYYSHRLAMG